jgi:hypothetical protein
MSGPKRNPDKLNTIGVVVVGICGAVLVYVSITVLQAFYVNDTSEIQTIADYGGNADRAKDHRQGEVRNINSFGTNAAGSAATTQTFHEPIDVSMKKVVEAANGPNGDPSQLVPALGPSTKPTIQPIFGRPKLIAPPPAPTAAPAAPAAGSGSAEPAPAPAPAAGSGSNAH